MSYWNEAHRDRLIKEGHTVAMGDDYPNTPPPPRNPRACRACGTVGEHRCPADEADGSEDCCNECGEYSPGEDVCRSCIAEREQEAVEHLHDLEGGR